MRIPDEQYLALAAAREKRRLKRRRTYTSFVLAIAWVVGASYLIDVIGEVGEALDRPLGNAWDLLGALSGIALVILSAAFTFAALVVRFGDD